MRIANSLFLLAVVVSCFLGPSNLREDDKDEKERWEKLEKELARFEPTLEKEEWAVKNKHSITELTKWLQKAERLEVFRLNPKRLAEDSTAATPSFHRHEILTKGPVETAEQRKEVVSFVAKTLHWNHQRAALCFNPRHGLRISAEEQTLDFLICFECWRVEVFEGDNLRATIALSQPKDNAIEQILQEIEKKAKERP
jgi:hypothetical protein